MISLIREENSEPPQQREETERDGDTGDGVPERSSIQWDGSRAELVADETEEFEDQQTGVQLSYSLREDELYGFLTKAYWRGKSKKIYGTDLFCSVLLIVLFSLQLGRYSELGIRVFYCAAIAIFAVRLAVMLARPLIRNHRAAQKGADGSAIRMTVYPDHIEVEGKRSGFEIPLDGSCERAVTDELIALYPTEIGEQAKTERKAVLLPLRCVDPAVLPEVQAMIFAGTRPARGEAE